MSAIRFFFYSNEGNPRGPMHIHVDGDGVEAKFWLWPEVQLAYNDGFNAKTLRSLLGVVEQRRDAIAEARNEFLW
ncbi:DUF4160 domain-containing protein [Phreatobacter sp. AB_2022a]|uniref:DUF4160 domain-containing protein n=1 Tax=Phreatobacter sp. AB_2022a TaxID=3003134 RepID=UPI002E212F1B